MSTNTEASGTSAVPVDATGATLRRAATASFIGNFVEWFDYASYGYLATVIAVVFFPESDAQTALMATFALFAISFVIRPIGGIVWGHIGDRFGRRVALSWSILIMSGATFLIAFLPGYAAIGVGAPLLLLALRIIQGFSASGEYAGASAFLAEYAPDRRRGFYTSLVPASTSAGLLLGSLLVTVMYTVLDTAQIESWGWRLPFLLAGPFGLIGRYIRLKLQDTPKFREMAAEAERRAEHTPIREIFTHHLKATMIAFGVTCLNAVAFYLVLSYMPTYLSTELGVSSEDSFKASTIALIAYIISVFVMGTLSDRFGRKSMLILASVLFIVLSVPLFMLLGSAGLPLIIVIEVVFGIMLTINDGTLPAFLSEIFPTSVRYSGFAVTFNTGNALFGGTAPLVATWLISVTGSSLAPAWYLVFAAAIALGAMLMIHETARQPLPD